MQKKKKENVSKNVPPCNSNRVFFRNMKKEQNVSKNWLH